MRVRVSGRVSSGDDMSARKFDCTKESEGGDEQIQPDGEAAWIDGAKKRWPSVISQAFLNRPIGDLCLRFTAPPFGGKGQPAKRMPTRPACTEYPAAAQFI